jgi:hypothetical protein
MSLMEHRPWWHISHRLPRNPFDPQFVIAHLEWCSECSMDVSATVEAANADGVNVYRKRCQRCGSVMQWGISKQNLLDPKTLPAKAFKFVRETGKDRR